MTIFPSKILLQFSTAVGNGFLFNALTPHPRYEAFSADRHEPVRASEDALAIITESHKYKSFLN